MPGFKGNYIPHVGMVLAFPAPLVFSSRMRTVHKKAAKVGLTKALQWHHKNILPLHFQPAARSRYNHHSRSNRYKQKKRKEFGSRLDLIKSGTTKRSMLQTRPKVTFPTKAAGRVGGGFTGRYEMRFPFPAGRDNKTPQGTKIRDMIREIESFTGWDAERTARVFQPAYAEELNRLLANSPRLRKRFGV